MKIINLFFSSVVRGKILSPISTLLIVLPMLFACSQSNQLTDQPKNDSDKRPVVLTTFTILADMARQVAGDRLQVRSITKPGAEIHGYEPSPKDLEQASGAD